METQYITQSDFVEFLEPKVRERVAELLKEIQAFQYIARDRGLFHHEKRRYNSLGQILRTNENILKSIDPEYQSIQ